MKKQTERLNQMLQKLDSVGGLLLTHAAVGVAGWLLARGWITAEQATQFAEQVKNNWPALLVGLGGLGGAVTANKKASRKR